ncbi:hypothetical protein [Nonomuraea angiospora]|uniref:hypothetical protein n=1 Tax=Nonomuraea angiospora TaxID=46172 RepID=UPI0029B6D51B|nr:hypothetical protein [Nonomuraea angiospora]MDX3101773.1 hypothetical protein [Nonomuraea angiospora]
MDSHGSATPTTPVSGATSRSAGGATVTRRRQTEHPEPHTVEPLRIEDLLALAEQVGDSAMCACGKQIVQLGTGVWRSDEHPLDDVDRIACTASKDKHHHPVRAGDLS